VELKAAKDLGARACLAVSVVGLGLLSACTIGHAGGVLERAPAQLQDDGAGMAACSGTADALGLGCGRDG